MRTSDLSLVIALVLAPPVAGAAYAPPAKAAAGDTSAAAGKLVSESDALAAMERGDYAAAFCYWQSRAGRGDAHAQYYIGWMYRNGYGLALNDRAAESWWLKAAEQGYVEAMFSLGTLYGLASETIPQDLSASLYYLIEAASRGHQDSLIALRELIARDESSIREQVERVLDEHWRLLGRPMVVKGDRVALRAGPGPSHAVVAVLERGTPVVEIARRAGWARVRLDNRPQGAWVSATLLTPSRRAAADSP